MYCHDRSAFQLKYYDDIFMENLYFYENKTYIFIFKVKFFEPPLLRTINYGRKNMHKGR